MTRTPARWRRNRIVRWIIAAMFAFTIIAAAGVVIQIGLSGYFDAYCVTKPEASGFHHIRGPSHNLLGRTVTCHYATSPAQIASNNTTDVTFSDSFPLTLSVTILAAASTLAVVVGRGILRVPRNRPRAASREEPDLDLRTDPTDSDEPHRG